MVSCKVYKGPKCLHQLFSPKNDIFVDMPDHGDCRKCKPCQENKKCAGFEPAPAFIVFEVKKEKT